MSTVFRLSGLMNLPPRESNTLPRKLSFSQGLRTQLAGMHPVPWGRFIVLPTRLFILTSPSLTSFKHDLGLKAVRSPWLTFLPTNTVITFRTCLVYWILRGAQTAQVRRAHPFSPNSRPTAWLASGHLMLLIP